MFAARGLCEIGELSLACCGDGGGGMAKEVKRSARKRDLTMPRVDVKYSEMLGFVRGEGEIERGREGVREGEREGGSE